MSTNVIAIGPIDNPGVVISAPRFGILENPGLGGTDLRDLQLAQELRRAGFEVVLFAGDTVSATLGDGTRVMPEQDLIALGARLVITRTSYLGKNPDLESLGDVIAVSHHPHDSWLGRESAKKCKAVVNVGEYQFWSNWRTRKQNVLITGYCPPVADYSENCRPNVIGHLSSLHPSKGFIETLKTWRLAYGRNKSKQPLTFEVIGGLKLYGEHEVDAEFHTTPKASGQIRSVFESGPHLFRDAVSFLGVQANPTHMIRERWAAAVLNPFGLGESDPLSFHECIASGVPVISGGLFGTHEIMKHFPELRALTRSRRAALVLRLAHDDNFFRKFRSRALQIAEFEAGMNTARTQKWISLVQSILEDHPKHPELRPNLPSSLRLLFILALGYGLEFGWLATSLLRPRVKIR